MKKYDVIVIGSGGGLKIALPCADRGLRVALIEQDAMGGTCLNRGCIPSKMLIYPADLVHDIRHAARVDVRIASRPRVDFKSLIERSTRTVDDMSRQMAERLERHPWIDLYRAPARFIADRQIRVGTEELTAERIFIATGSRPHIPDVPGLADTPFMTSREALRNTVLPARMVILGAGYIACELGHVYAACGTETHFAIRSRMLRSMDPDVRRTFEEVFACDHTLHQGCIPVNVQYDQEIFNVILRDVRNGTETVIEAEALLVATGVVPQTDDLGLEHTAIKQTAEGFIEVDDHLGTAVPGVYALGDCVGRYLFRHSVNFEAEYLMHTVFERPHKAPIQYGPMPYAVFTVPEIAGVGATENGLAAAGVEHAVGRSCYADSNVGLARQLDHGFAKILVHRQTRKLLGAHIVGPEAATMIHMLIAMLSLQADLDDLLKMIYVHPALPEVVRDAARDVRQRLEN